MFMHHIVRIRDKYAAMKGLTSAKVKKIDNEGETKTDRFKKKLVPKSEVPIVHHAARSITMTSYIGFGCT